MSEREVLIQRIKDAPDSEVQELSNRLVAKVGMTEKESDAQIRANQEAAELAQAQNTLAGLIANAPSSAQPAAPVAILNQSEPGNSAAPRPATVFPALSVPVVPEFDPATLTVDTQLSAIRAEVAALSERVGAVERKTVGR